MADISLLSRIVGGYSRNQDISANTLVTLSIKVGGPSVNTELTKTILDNLISNSHASGSDNQNVVAGLGLTGGGSGATVNLDVRLDNTEYLVARNAANSANVNMLRVNSSDRIEFATIPQVTGTPVANEDIVNKAYADGLSNGANTSLSNLTTTSINQTLLPSSNATKNIGSSSLRWSTLFVNTIADAAGNNSVIPNSRTLNTSAGTTVIDWSSTDVVFAGKLTNITDGTSAQDAVSKSQMETADGLKVSKSGDSMTGALAMGTNKITGLDDGTAPGDAVNKGQLDTKANDSAVIKKDGSVAFTAAQSMGGFKLTSVADGSSAQDAATFGQMGTADGLRVLKAGDTMSGNLAMGNNRVTGLNTPSAAGDAANKAYVDSLVSSSTTWRDPIVSPDLINIVTSVPGSPVDFGAYIAYGGSYPQTWGGITDVASGDIMEYQGSSTWLRIDTLSAGDRFIVTGLTGTDPGATLFSAGFRHVDLIQYVSGNPTLFASWSQPQEDNNQAVLFTSDIASGDATGLTNDATVYTASVSINGTPNAVTVTGSAAQTISTLLTQINADLTGASATIVAGHIHITGSGATDQIIITDTDLFSSITAGGGGAQIHGSVKAGTTVLCNAAGGYHEGHTFLFSGGAAGDHNWIAISGPGAINAGIGLAYTGNTLNINLGAGIAQLPTDEVGVDVHTNGGLFTTVDNSSASTVTGSQLAVKLDGSTLSKSSNGLKVATGGITNTEINASAAIAYSKLNLGSSIVNADIASGAAIAYSKLNLGSSIVDADIASGAAIAYSKLALTGAILNADLAGSIAYSKLSLTGAILNADLAGSIAYSKLSLTGAILNADLAGSIAYSKLVLSNSIVDADIASGAAIAYSKLALSNSIVAGDITSNAVTTAKINNAAVDKDKLASNVADQATITGGAGSSLAVAYAPFANQFKKTLVAGESFAANTSFLVRWGMDALAETSARVYKSDRSTGSADKFWVIGIALSTGAVSAGGNIDVVMLGEHTLGASDTAFGSSDVGKPVWLGATGLFSTTAPSASGDASVKIGIVAQTNKIWVDAQVMGVN